MISHSFVCKLKRGTMNTEKSCTPNSIFQECLEAPEPYSDEVEKETCRRLVDALPKELVTYCANTSYAYWHLARNKDTCPLEEYKISMAMREARRHLIYMTGYSFEETLASLTDCCQYRKVRLEFQLFWFKRSLPFF